MSGKEILERKVSVQLARKPEPAGEKAAPAAGGEGSGEEGKRTSGRGGRARGRGRGRGGRFRGGAREGAEGGEAITEPLPLTEVTNTEANKTPTSGNEAKKTTKEVRQPKQRGPPEDGIPSTTKVMVANLPYDLSEEKVSL